MQPLNIELITYSGIAARYAIGRTTIFTLKRVYPDTFPPVRGAIGRAPAFDHAEIVAFLQKHAPQYLTERQPTPDAAE